VAVVQALVTADAGEVHALSRRELAGDALFGKPFECR
jgi:hypothetical protein